MLDTILSDLADSAVPKYSPGPWHTRPAGDRIEVRDARGRLVADVAARADARLVVRGPELVAAARNLIAAIANQQDDITDEVADLLEHCYTASGGTPSPDSEGGS